MGLTKYIFQNVMGWNIQGNFDKEIKKAVVIVVPHTSWHDFYIGAFTRKIVNTEINFIAKSELFKWPFGWYFRWMGGAPLDRTPGQNKVEAIAELFKDKEIFRLALSPEGTRKKVTDWKTGYYYVALKAKVPIICVAFDYGTKTVKIREPYHLSGNFQVDSKILQSFYDGVLGKKPEYSFERLEE